MQENAFNANNIQEAEQMNEPKAPNSINPYGPIVKAKAGGKE